MQENNGRVIAVFAHNESQNITACLESVKRAIKVGDSCYVLNNGSSDNTGTLVNEFIKTNSFCNLIAIEMGDKANAWNVFVHELNITASLFCFLDGDCVITPNSIDALEKCSKDNPFANAVAALPHEQTSKKNREEMLRDGGLAGNLYALSRNFVDRIRSNNIRLPLGLIGDDSLIGALIYWDLNPTENDWDKRRIAPCEEATFSYEPLSIFSSRDIKLYYRRKLRYSLRHFQMMLFKPLLKEQGLAGIPQHIDDLYVNYTDQLKLAWRWTDTWFDYFALRQIKKTIAAHKLKCQNTKKMI
jgi:glycosyltransferase involved in cell wall biosynthesis